MSMINQEYSSHYLIYTDGSKTENDIGAGLFDSQLNVSLKLKLVGECSIMRAELVAVVEALSYALTLSCNKILILCDSKSALQHLLKCISQKTGLPIAYEAIKLIIQLRTTKQIKLQWIPSHIGIEGNEVADRLAGSAALDGIKHYLKPYAAEMLYSVKRKCLELWSESFKRISADKGIWYFTIQNVILKLPWFDGVGLDRDTIVLALRLRSGHMPLNDFYYLVRHNSSSLCEVCAVKEDLTHLLCECDRTVLLRNNLKIGINSLDIGVINAILSCPLSDRAKTLYKYARQCLSVRAEGHS